jgi:AraC-like DNA-binding protein
MSGETTFRRARARGVPGADMVGYRSDGVPEGVHLGVPGPRLTFILSLDAPVVTAMTAADLETGRTVRADVLLAGLHPRATHVVQPRRQEGIQLAVDPLLARSLFGRPAAELAGTVLDESLLDAGLRRLWHRVGEAGGWERRFALVADELRNRRDEVVRPPRPEVAAAWRLLRERRGRVSVEELSRRVLLSSRQLRDELRREVGVTPKTAARLFRLEHAVSRMAAAVRAGRSPAFATVAAECGYADQAHLTRDVTGLLGRSPTEWVVEERRNLQAGGHAHGAG